jgi:hypothetical protein
MRCSGLARARGLTQPVLAMAKCIDIQALNFRWTGTQTRSGECRSA